MRLSLSRVLMLAAALALVPGPVSAQPDLSLPANPLTCMAGLTSVTMPMNFDMCWGTYSGTENHYTTAILATLNGWDPGAWALLEKVDVGNTGAYFTSLPGLKLGTIGFSPILGPFALALKGGPNFSFFYYENSGGGGLGSVPFNMDGVSGNALSHASLYATSTDVVPEPSTVILLGTGLVGLFGVEYRRRKKKA